MRTKYTIIGTACILLSLLAQTANAQEERGQRVVSSYLRGWEYAIKAGFNIGGTSPIPLPKEIRSLDSYSPGLAIAIEGNATKWFDKKWGMTIGLRFENKKMHAAATTKGYGMKIITINDEGKVQEMQGLWTGGVKTKVDNSYLTIPIVADYQIAHRWKISLGPYISWRLEGDFSGYVYDGYLRTPDETGERVNFTDDSTANYDFSSDLRRFQWGWQLGAEWRAYKHLNVYADFTWGMNDIFKKGFDTITFAMYPIYLNIGFEYSF